MSTRNINTWQDAVKDLDEANQQFKKLYSIMTPLEKHFVTEQIAETREKYRRAIEEGAIAQHTEAINNLKSKLARVESERRILANSWNQHELSAALQVAEMRINHAAKAGDLDSLKAIYQEAKESGDRVKQRAVAEAMQNVTEKFPTAAQDSHGESMRRSVNLMEKQAARELQKLQTSQGLEEAHKAAAQAVQQLDDARRQMVNANDAMSDRNLSLNQTLSIPLNMSFEKALERCTQDQSGNFHFKEEPPAPVEKTLTADQRKLMHLND
jgi:hypothetical protein